jgi:hypothetical protein
MIKSTFNMKRRFIAFTWKIEILLLLALGSCEDLPMPTVKSTSGIYITFLCTEHVLKMMYVNEGGTGIMFLFDCTKCSGYEDCLTLSISNCRLNIEFNWSLKSRRMAVEYLNVDAEMSKCNYSGSLEHSETFEFGENLDFINLQGFEWSKFR